jgi:DNA-binding GntR family transcriptional regulator
LDIEKLFERIHTMIMSSSKAPKYMAMSTVKIADIFGVAPMEIEKGLQQLVEAGRLSKMKMEEPPHNEIYQLPGVTTNRWN